MDFFIDLEVRRRQPVLVGVEYSVTHEVVAMGQVDESSHIGRVRQLRISWCLSCRCAASPRCSRRRTRVTRRNSLHPDR